MSEIEAISLIDLPFAVRAVASEGMDSSSSSHYFTTVCCAAWDEIFLACIYRNPLSVDDEGVTSLYD